MIAKLATGTALFFANKNVYKHDKLDTYKYGFELLISTIINALCLLSLSILMGMVLETIFFAVSFISLRSSAGGYHAKHHWSCIIGTSATFLMFALVLRFINPDFMLPYSLLAVLASSLIIWVFSPVEAANKPLEEQKRKDQRNRSIILSSINMVIVILSFVCSFTHKAIIAFYISGALAASLSLVIAVAARKTKSFPLH